VQNRKYLIYFGSQKTRTEIHNGSFGSISSVPVLGYFGSVPRFRFFLPRPNLYYSIRTQHRPWCTVLPPHGAYDPHVSVSFLPRARPLPSTPASAWSSSQSPHRSISQSWKEKSRHCHRRKHIPSPLSTRRCNLAHRNPIVDDAQDHPSPNRSTHAPQMPPISSAPQTQSMPRRHGRNHNPIPSSSSSAHDHHRPASHRKCRTTPPSHSSHSMSEPRLDLPMLEYFSFYAPAPPRSCDARV
jgi:hypothetical protein